MVPRADINESLEVTGKVNCQKLLQVEWWRSCCSQVVVVEDIEEEAEEEAEEMEDILEGWSQVITQPCTLTVNG